jgi:ATP-dependent RNA helicase MSS116
MDLLSLRRFHAGGARPKQMGRTSRFGVQPARRMLRRLRPQSLAGAQLHTMAGRITVVQRCSCVRSTGLRSVRGSGGSGRRRWLSTESSFTTAASFAEQQQLSPQLRRALASMGLENMTEIQAATIGPALEGRDVLGRARTGTGKTVAFLVPSLERTAGKSARQRVDVLAISPTRELASQIADQGELLLARDKKRGVQVMFGGTKKPRDMARLERRTPALLVATPGRLLDHLRSTSLRDGTAFSDLLSDVQVLVLDEADQLLEMGFRNDVMEILRYLPAAKQTLLFSATVPPGVKEVMGATMHKDFVTVDCIGEGGGADSSATHSVDQVPQSHVLLPSNGRAVAGVLEVVEAAQASAPTSHKIIAFFPTAQMTAFYAYLFNSSAAAAPPLQPAIEIHSRKSQAQRTRSSEKFRQSRCAVMFSSDVSARGVDYPDVTHVLQFGLPASTEQYIHRLGRTGRAGKLGKGVLVLSPFEEPFLSELKSSGLDCPPDPELNALMESPPAAAIMKRLEHSAVAGGGDGAAIAVKAYQAFLGYHNGQTRRISLQGHGKQGLVALANDFARACGLEEPPALQARTIGKMGERTHSQMQPAYQLWEGR